MIPDEWGTVEDSMHLIDKSEDEDEQDHVTDNESKTSEMQEDNNSWTYQIMEKCEEQKYTHCVLKI